MTIRRVVEWKQVQTHRDVDIDCYPCDPDDPFIVEINEWYYDEDGVVQLLRCNPDIRPTQSSMMRLMRVLRECAEHPPQVRLFTERQRMITSNRMTVTYKVV